MRNGPIQAFMENGKKLDIIQIVQSLSKGFRGPLIPDESSQDTGNFDFLAWLNGVRELKRLRCNGLEELGALNEEMYGSRCGGGHASGISNADVMDKNMLSGLVDSISVFVDDIKLHGLEEV